MPPYAAAAAAASRMAAIHASAHPHSEPAPLGVRALVAAIAPYAATSRIFLVDAAAESSAAAASGPSASFVRDLIRGVAPHLPIIAASTTSSHLPLIAASTTNSIGARVPHRQPYLATGFVDATATPAATRASGIGELGHLFASTAAGTARHLLVGTASAAASLASSIGAPGRLIVSTDGVSGASRHLAGGGIGAPRHLFTTTRALSTNTGPGKPNGAGMSRQLNNTIKREAARTRQEVGVEDSLNPLRRYMGYGPLARFIGLFTMFTIISKGITECNKRFGEVSVILSWLRENGQVKEEIMVGDNFSWLFD